MPRPRLVRCGISGRPGVIGTLHIFAGGPFEGELGPDFQKPFAWQGCRDGASPAWCWLTAVLLGLLADEDEELAEDEDEAEVSADVSAGALSWLPATKRGLS